MSSPRARIPSRRESILVGDMAEPFLEHVAARKGHFLLESGHHGDLWLDLESLCLEPARIRPFASELARRLAPFRVEVVCGPLVEGAFVALMVAEELRAEFVYAERSEAPRVDGGCSATYRIPAALRGRLRGKRVAIVNDVINAGAAVRGAYSDLNRCAAHVVVVGSLLVLGQSAAELAREWKIDLVSIASRSNTIWRPSDCPLCAAGVPLEDVPSATT